MNDGIGVTATCVTVAQLANANRAHTTAPFKLGNTTFEKVILLGNLARVPEIEEDSGQLQFELDDSTGRILVKLFNPENFPLSSPYSEYPFSTLLRVIGTLYVSRRNNSRMLKAGHCSLIEDPYAPYHHLLQAVADYVQNEKGPFPSDPPTIVEQVAHNRQAEEEEANWEQSGLDFQELTSSLANTKLDSSDVPAGLPIPVKPRDRESSSGSGGSSGHLYPPQSPLRQSVSPPRVAYYPKATSGDLDNSFVFLATEGTPNPPKPNGNGARHVYPPHSQYPRDNNFDNSAGTEEAPAPVCAPPTDFAGNGDLDESFVFLDSNQVQSRANGAPYLPSTRHRMPLVSEMSISPSSRSFLRRHSPPQRDTPSKKVRLDPYSRLNTLERDIILTVSTRSGPASLYYNDKSDNATSRGYIIETLTRKRPELSSREIATVLEKLVNEGYLIRPIDQDHFVIN